MKHGMPTPTSVRTTCPQGDLVRGWSCRVSAVAAGLSVAMGWLRRTAAGQHEHLCDCGASGAAASAADACAEMLLHHGVERSAALDLGLQWANAERR